MVLLLVVLGNSVALFVHWPAWKRTHVWEDGWQPEYVSKWFARAGNAAEVRMVNGDRYAGWPLSTSLWCGSVSTNERGDLNLDWESRILDGERVVRRFDGLPVGSSPDGQRVFTFRRNRTAAIWSVSSGECLYEFPAAEGDGLGNHRGEDYMQGVAVSPDGVHLVYGFIPCELYRKMRPEGVLGVLFLASFWFVLFSALALAVSMIWDRRSLASRAAGEP